MQGSGEHYNYILVGQILPSLWLYLNDDIN